MNDLRLPRSFYAQDTTTVARALLGQVLTRVNDGVHQRARIVEVEAYLGAHDLASHSSKGRTPRTSTMFGPPGHAYVYLIYGVHHCLSVVTEPEGHGAAVMIRAVEPLAHIGGNTRGPGLLCRALGVDRRLNGHDLLSDDLHIGPPTEQERFATVCRPRVGVDFAGEWAGAELRFYIEGNAYVSKR